MANKKQSQKVYGKCRVNEELGRGAASVVYKGYHESFQIPVAVKVVPKQKVDQQGENAGWRIMREARVAAQLTHPNIVRIYDCGEADDCYYLAMEYVEGETCRSRLDRKGPFPWRRGVEVILQVLDGLRHALRKNIIHRDIKPENIMIDAEDHARIADLGLAKEWMPGRASGTVQGEVLGTPYYMSPEQVRSPGEVDFRSDIYALGATLYHLVTGSPPFEADSPFQVMTKQVSTPPPSPKEKNPELPDALCGIIMRAMAKDPDERYQSYGNLKSDLVRMLSGDAPEESSGDAGGLSRGVRNINAGRLPAGADNLRAKAMGLGALLTYVILITYLFRFLFLHVGVGGALAGVLALLALSVAWSCLSLWDGEEYGDGAESSDPIRTRLQGVVNGVCDALSLPTPRIYLPSRNDNAHYTYSFFSHKASLDLPASWMRERDPETYELRTLLVQCMGSVCSGDSHIRTLLALPLEALKVARSWGWKVLGVFSPSSPGRLHLARTGAVTATLALAGLVGFLFWVSVPAGILAALAAGVMGLVAAFERASRRAEDAFAARVLGSPDMVKFVISTSVPEGEQAVHLRRQGREQETPEREDSDDRESKDKKPTEKKPDGEDEEPDEDASLVGRFSFEFSRHPYRPSVLDRLRMLLSPVPLAPQRLNELAGVARPALPLKRVVWPVWKVLFDHAAPRGESQVMTLDELGLIRFQAVLGATVGAIAALVTALIFHLSAAYYGLLLGGNAALAVVFGLALAGQAYGTTMSPRKLAWNSLVTSTFFASISAVVLCLVGGSGAGLAVVQVPVSFVMVTLGTYLTGLALLKVFARPTGETATQRQQLLSQINSMKKRARRKKKRKSARKKRAARSRQKQQKAGKKKAIVAKAKKQNAAERKVAKHRPEDAKDKAEKPGQEVAKHRPEDEEQQEDKPGQKVGKHRAEDEEQQEDKPGQKVAKHRARGAESQEKTAGQKQHEQQAARRKSG